MGGCGNVEIIKKIRCWYVCFGLYILFIIVVIYLKCDGVWGDFDWFWCWNGEWCFGGIWLFGYC